MSNSLAIAAVTKTLTAILSRSIQLEPTVGGSLVTATALDRANADPQMSSHLNLFLYQVEHSATLHDSPNPSQGRNAPPPLALTLYYLLTAYGTPDDDSLGHQLLGRGMQALFDMPVLQQEDIQTALSGNDLYEQIERVHITRHPITLDELSKLWGMFQSEYRVSVAYQVSVIFIESRRTAASALPILRRGAEDRGVYSQANMLPPVPTIEDPDLRRNEPVVILPTGQAARRWKPDRAQLGDKVQFRGYSLSGNAVVVRFSNPRLRVVSNPPAPGDHPSETEDIAIIPAESSDGLATITVPDAPAAFPAGVYTAAIVVTTQKMIDGQRYDSVAVSNEVALAIAPQIIRKPLPIPPQPWVVNRDADGTVVFQLTCKPAIRPNQRVSLFLNSIEIRLDVVAIANQEDPAEPAWTLPTSDLIFTRTAVAVGEYVMRLRVDGVDSFPIVQTADARLTFDPNYKVDVR